MIRTAMPHSGALQPRSGEGANRVLDFCRQQPVSLASRCRTEVQGARRTSPAAPTHPEDGHVTIGMSASLFVQCAAFVAVQYCVSFVANALSPEGDQLALEVRGTMPITGAMPIQIDYKALERARLQSKLAEIAAHLEKELKPYKYTLNTFLAALPTIGGTGHTPKQRSGRISGIPASAGRPRIVTRAQFTRDVKAGMTSRAIAEKYGRSRSWASQRKEQYGLVKKRS